MRFSCDVSRLDKFDVVVCGSGPAGIAAAIQSSREGLSVALVEQSGCLGGNMTSGGVCHLLGGRRWDDENQKMVREVGGLFDEITDSLIKDKKAIDPDTIDVHNNNPFGWYPRMAAGIPCDIEALKLHLDKMVSESNISVFLFTTVVGAEVSENEVKYIYAFDQSGARAFEAKTFIDATGDAQLAFLAGCPVFKGRDEDHLMTPATLIAHIDQVDMDEYVKYQNEHQSPKLIEIINRLKEEGIWDFPFEIFIAIELNSKDVCMLNTVRQVGIDGTDAESLTHSMMQGRDETDRLLKIMREHFPGFRNARLRMTANRVGIRESRRIDGRAYVTLQDALDGRTYEDEAVRTTYNFDLPDPKRPSFDPMLGSVENPNAKRKHIGIQAPYGSLLPKKIDNLLVCGRCISVCREVLGPMRVTGPAMMCGQSAGIAAGLAKEKNVNVASIDGRSVKEKLIQINCKV